MTALLDLVESIDDVALSEIALSDLLNRCERMHRSNIQHDPMSCLVCFEHH